MERGVCATLPPEVARKFFDANAARERFEFKTAQAICSRCPVMDDCLRVGLTLSFNDAPGIMAGLSRTGLYRLRRWRAYDAGQGIRPRFPRPADPLRAEPSPAEAQAQETRRVTDLSFEERVWIVFREVREGKYKRLNDAISEIGRLHRQEMQER
jgi:hypothetical protein